jgi:hypothetical protein
LSYKPSHELPAGEAFKRLAHADKVIDKLHDFLYAPASTPVPEDD